MKANEKIARKGISLITLIITIIVVIILSVVVILTINKNNSIENAREARFKDDVLSFKDDLALTISKEYTKSQGGRNTKINATGYSKDKNNQEKYNNSVYKYIPSFTEDYEGKFAIKDDTLICLDSTSKVERKWLADIGIKDCEKIDIEEDNENNNGDNTGGNTGDNTGDNTGGNTGDNTGGNTGDNTGDNTGGNTGDNTGGGNIEDEKTAVEEILINPKSYYGKKITNYTANGISDWKIFYADKNNVYIITSTYVPTSKLPATKKGNKPAKNNTYSAAAYLGTVTKDYTGTVDITDSRIRALNSKYFSGGASNQKANIKSVAYLLDIDIWKIFAGEKAEYAVGTPTIEMLLKSYSQSHDVDYRCTKYNDHGYKISKDGGSNYANYYTGMLSTSDTLYVLPKGSASAMWVASPNAGGAATLFVVEPTGKVNSKSNTSAGIGCRAVVCLKPEVTLKQVANGFEIH